MSSVGSEEPPLTARTSYELLTPKILPYIQQICCLENRTNSENMRIKMTNEKAHILACVVALKKNLIGKNY